MRRRGGGGSGCVWDGGGWGGPEPVFEAGKEGYDDCFSLVGLGGGSGMAPFINLAVVLVVVVPHMFHMD